MFAMATLMGVAAGAADSFDRADTTLVNTLGANWAGIVNGHHINSNAAGAASSVHSVSAWATGSLTFGNNQRAKVWVGNRLSSSVFWVGCAVRCSGSSGYVFRSDGATGSGHSEFGKFVSGTYTAIAAITMTCVSGDELWLDINGTTWTAYKNGTSVGTGTDSTFSSGQPGIYGFDTGEVTYWSAA